MGFLDADDAVFGFPGGHSEYGVWSFARGHSFCYWICEVTWYASICFSLTCIDKWNYQVSVLPEIPFPLRAGQWTAAMETETRREVAEA